MKKSKKSSRRETEVLISRIFQAELYKVSRIKRRVMFYWKGLMNQLIEDEKRFNEGGDAEFLSNNAYKKFKKFKKFISEILYLEKKFKKQ